MTCPLTSNHYLSERIGWRLEFKPADLWVGLYWERQRFDEVHFWLCLIPCFPLHVWWIDR